MLLLHQMLFVVTNRLLRNVAKRWRFCCPSLQKFWFPEMTSVKFLFYSCTLQYEWYWTTLYVFYRLRRCQTEHFCKFFSFIKWRLFYLKTHFIALVFAGSRHILCRNMSNCLMSLTVFLNKMHLHFTSNESNIFNPDNQ